MLDFCSITVDIAHILGPKQMKLEAILFCLDCTNTHSGTETQT